MESSKFFFFVAQMAESRWVTGVINLLVTWRGQPCIKIQDQSASGIRETLDAIMANEGLGLGSQTAKIVSSWWSRLHLETEAILKIFMKSRGSESMINFVFSGWSNLP